ncbi:hypothetical protein [Aquimarina sp. 2201CG14-23]|uniref:hypothetical protein n=1 Tax=Aquimarina mycalae TaxID=3040073 RepID=UPI002477CDC9|nr:hypothetical protein [Aquimarina sp. 2201CG14-23]MDH7444043.1 hypothetical protein [Aquimarina sp. 2201CG14-23]
MKSFKLIMFFVLSLTFATYTGTAQQLNSSNSEMPISNQVKSKSATKSKTKTIKRAKTRAVTGVNTSETAKLHSKSEIEARALTAQKTRNSGKANIPKEVAVRQREARIQAAIEANKTKKKTTSKRKTGN